jgi:hypothetical protein
LDDPKIAIRRRNGFDHPVKARLVDAVGASDVFNTAFGFVLSSISRSRALHEAIVREIGPEAANRAENKDEPSYSRHHPAIIWPFNAPADLPVAKTYRSPAIPSGVPGPALPRCPPPKVREQLVPH